MHQPHLLEAFTLVYDADKRLSAISDKIDVLLSNTNKEPAAPPQPILAELGDKLDKVSQEVQKVAETWKTVPAHSHTRSPPPPSAPANATALAGPTCLDITRNRHIQSQGCFILVEPTSDAIKKTFDGLNVRMLAQKAELAWDSAWNVVKATNIAKDLKLTDKPQVVFKAALRLARGGIRYKLGDHTQATLLSNARLWRSDMQRTRGYNPIAVRSSPLQP
ncbi:hypothetical protein RSOL_051960, partial [Rhizoctonia solani AG-3 Rhs1AP]